MKPNGKYFSVRAVVVMLCTVSLFSAIGNAATVHGKFKLPTETRWGQLLLSPGEYKFTISDDATSMIVTVSSTDSGWSGMILSEGVSDPDSMKGSKLLLGKSDEGTYVRSLALGDLGVMLNFREPKAGKVTRLMLPPSTEVASASGSH